MSERMKEEEKMGTTIMNTSQNKLEPQRVSDIEVRTDGMMVSRSQKVHFGDPFRSQHE